MPNSFPASFSVDESKQLIAQLAQTPGPSLGEEPRLALIEHWCAEHDLPATRDAAGNLWVWLHEGPWEDAILYDAHVDVVERGVADAVREEEGLLVGAGVGDNLAAVALLLLFGRQWRRERRTARHPLALLLSVGEEGLGNLKGMRQLVADHPTAPRLLVSFDGGMNEYSISGLGSRRFRLSVEGPGGHSWNDYGRPSAIDFLMQVLLSLQLMVELQNNAPHQASFNIGAIGGGEGINSIARHAEAQFEFRGISAQWLENATREMRRKIEELGGEGISVALEGIGERPAAPARILPEELARVQAVWTRHDVLLRETARSTNINLPLAHGWPAICLGLCRMGRTHRPDEFVRLDSLETGWNLLQSLSE